MSFTEEWFPAESQTLLAELAARVEEVPGRVIEVGCWEGRSTVALVNAAWPRIVDAVDTWNGSPGEPSADLAAERDVYATWEANIEELTRCNVDTWRMDWREYADRRRGEPIALAFIDATHTYDEVRDNILAFLPDLAPGGIICGDDMHDPEVRRAVLDCLPNSEVMAKATVWWWQR